MIIVLGIYEEEDFHHPEIPLEKTREIDSKARISRKTEIKRTFNRNQKRITPCDIQVSYLTSLIRPILSDINTSTYKWANFLVPLLKPFTSYNYTIKDSFDFAKDNFG